MMKKLVLIIIASIATFYNVFAQTDTTKINKAVIDKFRAILNQFKSDGDYYTREEKTDKLLAINFATNSTIGLFPSDLLESHTDLKYSSYLWRFYVDIKFKEPYLLFVEHIKGNKIKIKRKNIEKIEKNKEAFFKKMIVYLENAKNMIAIKTEVEQLMKQALENCEKYKDCEHCWLIKDCSK